MYEDIKQQVSPFLIMQSTELKHSYPKKRIVIGIDATNLRQGGGRTHLIELLRVENPEKQGISRVVVWGSKATLKLLDDRPWLEKVSPPAQEAGLIRRTLWQRFEFSKAAREVGCDILFVPGGSYAGDFHPVVTMSQNMLPFEMEELRRYGLSSMTLKLILLRFTQSRSFRYSDGVIFLTEYARNGMKIVAGKLRGQSAIIPHGMQSRFLMPPRTQRAIGSCSDANPFRLLYVSIIDQYKHQWHVVEAVAKVRELTGWPLVLDLVGPAYPPALKRLNKNIAAYDTNGLWVQYYGAMSYDDLHDIYAKADLGIFASSCENMPIILLETMAAGLPVASSNRGPMPEVLDDAGVYFDPEQPESIAVSLKKLIRSPQLRSILAQAAYKKAQSYSWDRCARDTFGFLVDVYHQYHETR